jgi:hypothetical protein
VLYSSSVDLALGTGHVIVQTPVCSVLAVAAPIHNMWRYERSSCTVCCVEAVKPTSSSLNNAVVLLVVVPTST